MIIVACSGCNENLTNQREYPSYQDALDALDKEPNVSQVGDDWFCPSCAPAQPSPVDRS